MHFEITRLSSKGQVVIPGQMRKQIGLKAGAKFCVFTDGKSIMLQPIAAQDVTAFHKIHKEVQKVTQRAKSV